MINHAIGATGVVSQECKAVVEQYGQTIMDLLLSEVVTIYLCFSCNFHKVHVVYYNLSILLDFSFEQCQQARPQKICSQIGLCAFDGAHGVRLVPSPHPPPLHPPTPNKKEKEKRTPFSSLCIQELPAVTYLGSSSGIHSNP